MDGCLTQRLNWDELFFRFSDELNFSKTKFKKYTHKLTAMYSAPAFYDLKRYWEAVSEYKTRSWFSFDTYPVFPEIEELYEKAYQLQKYEEDIRLLSKKGYEEKAREHSFLEQTIGSYQFVIPKTGKEIKEEAQYMQNCLWLRTNSYLEDKWIFVYMRRLSKPDVPFVDLVLTKQSPGYAYGLPAWIILKNHEYVRTDSDEGKAIKTWYKKCFDQDIIWPKENKRS